MKQQDFKEIVLGPSEKEMLLDFNGFGIHQIDSSKSWHYIAYLEKTKEVIVYQSSNTRSKVMEVGGSLADYLSRKKRISFKDLLFLCTLYPVLMPSSQERLNLTRDNEILPPLMRKILNFGNGYFFYYHQLEILYSLLTNCSHEESFLFRRDWNLKKEYTRDRASKIMISDGSSLLDFIIKYSVDDNLFFYQANYYGAYLLCREH
jgi:hypothetical protein